MNFLSIAVPTIPSGNIHAPVVMVAEKGADMVKELWLQPGVVESEVEENNQIDSFSFDSYSNITLV